ncbi:MAG: DNA-binding protein [Oscillospiraceae bacterium]|nr:DNA-binding protein [Oscillospiraceae bacterium]
MAVKLIKQPDNAHDSEAIKVERTCPGLVGYVANSPHTILGESFGDGRLYDRISDTAEGNVLYVLPNGILCTLEKEA